jgi:hypothetical protein
VDLLGLALGDKVSGAFDVPLEMAGPVRTPGLQPAARSAEMAINPSNLLSRVKRRGSMTNHDVAKADGMLIKLRRLTVWNFVFAIVDHAPVLIDTKGRLA